MAKVLVSNQYLEDIANTIRSKKSVNTTYTPAEMTNAILSIPTGTIGYFQPYTYHLIYYYEE